MRRALTLVLLLSCGRTEPVRPARETLLPPTSCALSIEPRALDFGVVSPGVETLQRAVIRNTGSARCDLGTELGATNDPTFSIVEDATTPLFPGDTATVTVRFVGAATVPAERHGTLHVHSTSPGEPDVFISLSARVAFCSISASPNPLDFGNVALNTTVTGHVTLSNVGTVACEVRDVALEPGTDPLFRLQAPPPQVTLQPGESVALNVNFTASDSAPPHLREGRLGFRSSDLVAPQQRVALSAYINTLCTQAGQFIYTVDGDGRFSRFDPRTLTYLDIAPLQCPTMSTPFSMNVDQNAMAWVIFGDGNLFRVDTATGQCSATSYVPNQSGFFTYGMGSVFDSRAGTDTLFLSGQLSTPGSTALGTLSFPALAVTSIGTLSMDQVELAGTGDNQLWAFAPAQGTQPAQLARVNPTNAALLERYELPTVTSVGGWAIKFFGGAFFIFIGSDIWKVERASLDPMRLNPTTAPVRVLTSPGRDIVGAGVSTCAPIQ